MSSEKPKAKDLSREEPAPMDATLGGYPWLPRMIDKARAARACSLGDYFRYPCPIDHALLAELGISAAAFADLAESHDNLAVLRELTQRGVPRPTAIDFAPNALLARLHRDHSTDCGS